MKINRDVHIAHNSENHDFTGKTMKSSSSKIRSLLLKEECEKYFKLALTQIPICSACLASSHLTEVFPNLPRQIKPFCSLKEMLLFR